MKKVLLVEDDPFIRDLTSIKLTEHSYSVLIASDGASVLELMRKESPDVVLLDLDLPDIPGLDVLMKMKNDPQLKDTPVVIFSNNDNPETKKRAEALGTTGFFVKATTAFDDLLKHIESVTA